MVENTTNWPFSKGDALVCEICCKGVESSKCELLEGILLEVFQVVINKLNFTTTQPVICKECRKKLLDVFECKSKWIYIEDRLFPYVNSDIDGKVDIKTVYFNKSNSKQTDVKSEIQICRLCMESVNDNSWNLLVDVLEKRYSLEFFEKYVPDLNLNATESPIICKKCLNSLNVFMDFIAFCVGEEAKKEQNIEEVKTEEFVMEMKTEYFEVEDETKPGGTNPVLSEELEQNKEKQNSSKDALEIMKYTCGSKNETSLPNHGSPSNVEIFKRASLSQRVFIHKPLHEVKNFKCEFCSYKTKYKGNLKNHSLVHKSLTMVEVFKCEFCSFETKHKRYLPKHMLIHKRFSEVKLFKCDICSYKTKRKNALPRHIMTHKPLSQLKLFRCKICSYVTQRKDSFRRHILTHKSFSSVDVFKCEFCSYKTKYRERLPKHILIHKPPSSVEVFKCEFCSYKTKHKEYLPKHLLIHKSLSNVKVFKCEFCSFETRHKGYLPEHLSIHKVDKLKCEFCSFRCKHKKTLSRHILVHKPLSEVEVFKCEFCSYQSWREKGLKEHLKTHN